LIGYLVNDMIYIIIGFFIWLTDSLCRINTFKSATKISIVNGLIIGILLWPLALILLGIQAKEDISK
jgi:hypothetical protein